MLVSARSHGGRAPASHCRAGRPVTTGAVWGRGCAVGKVTSASRPLPLHLGCQCWSLEGVPVRPCATWGNSNRADFARIFLVSDAPGSAAANERTNERTNPRAPLPQLLRVVSGNPPWGCRLTPRIRGVAPPPRASVLPPVAVPTFACRPPVLPVHPPRRPQLLHTHTHTHKMRSFVRALRPAVRRSQAVSAPRLRQPAFAASLQW